MLYYWTFQKPSILHRRLLHKLDYYGDRGRNRQWIAHFLHGREQTVVLGGASSPSAPITSGVPQGTVLGPLYQSPPHECAHSHAWLFANNCIVYRYISTHQHTGRRWPAIRRSGPPSRLGANQDDAVPSRQMPTVAHHQQEERLPDRLPDSQSNSLPGRRGQIPWRNAPE